MFGGAGLGLALAAAGGYEAVDAGVLPGRSTMHRVLGLNGPPGTIPDVDPGPAHSGRFRSAARSGAATGWTISYPPRAPKRLRPLIVLHGRGADHRSAFGDQLGLDRFLAELVTNGAAPFAIASVDGGDHSYWHARNDGEDAGRMVIDEFIPLLAAQGLDTTRVGLLGWSMGGYGALLLGGQLGAARTAVVVAESPAIWHHAGDTPSGAFDDAADFEAHTVFGRERQLHGIPVRLDCGTGDGFYPAARDYARSLTRAGITTTGGFEPGGHDLAYWRRMAPAQLQYVSQRLPA